MFFRYSYFSNVLLLSYVIALSFYIFKYVLYMSAFIKSTCLLSLLFSVGVANAQQFEEKSFMYNFPGHSANLSAGDIDNDGHLDILVASSFTDDVISVFRNDGEGNYSECERITFFDWPDAKLADLDGDGNLDIIAASYIDDKIGWYKNHGNGNFYPLEYHSINSSINTPRDIEVHDMDNDGDLDVIFHYSPLLPHRVYIAYNNGSGSFNSSTTLPVDMSNYAIRSIAIGDIDGDGNADVLCGKSGELSWFRNLNNTGFTDEIPLSDDLAADYVHGLDLMDYDHDGDDDVFFGTINYTNGQVSSTEVGMFESHGDSTFADKVVIATNTFNQGEIVHKDMDLDGDFDLVTTANNNNSVLWYENIGCEFVEHVIPSSGSTYTEVITTDANGDGKPDLITNGSSKRLMMYTQNTIDDFQETLISANGGTETPFALHATDIDGDGDLDVVSTSIDDEKIAWYENLGESRFSYQRIISTQNSDPKFVTSADFDQDGDMDIASASGTGNSIYWYKQGNNQSFSNQITISTNTEDATSVFAADLNQDGYPDLLSSSYEDQKIAWYKNNGNGGFGNQTVLTSSADGAQLVLAADLDNDTIPDVLYASINDHTIGWFHNNGNDTFSPETVISDSNTFVTWIDVFDADNDGDLDIISCSIVNGDMLWYENDGTGVFEAPQLIADNEDFGMVSLSDVDLDGDQDILATRVFDNSIVWIENLGSGSFGTVIEIDDEVQGPKNIIGVDVDQDGDFDAITTAFAEDKIYISENLQNQQTEITLNVCDSFISADGDTVYYASGDYIDSLTNQFGGDSIVYLQLNVGGIDSTYFNDVLCAGDTFFIENTGYAQSGSFSQTLTNQCGLDSTIFLTLTVSEPDSVVLIDTICGNDCFGVGNSSYTTTGEYIDTLVNQCGYDSIVYTSLFVNSYNETNLTETVCYGDSVFVGGEPYTTTGVHEVYLDNMFGCDSLVVLDLTVTNFNTQVLLNSGTLVCATPNADAYQWVDCNNNDAPIAGATAYTYTPTANGSYAVLITLNGCEKRSACKTVNGIGIEDYQVIDMTVSPNPATDVLEVSFGKEIENGRLTITDMIGRIHQTVEVNATKQTQLDVSKLPLGVYLVNGYFDNAKPIVKRIVKK